MSICPRFISSRIIRANFVRIFSWTILDLDVIRRDVGPHLYIDPTLFEIDPIPMIK